MLSVLSSLFLVGISPLRHTVESKGEYHRLGDELAHGHQVGPFSTTRFFWEMPWKAGFLDSTSQKALDPKEDETI